MFKRSFAALILVFSTSTAFADRYPTAPQEEATPGSLCQNADDYRYPEHIAYCERNVQSSVKQQIIEDYDRRFGYEIDRMDRGLFKIDHFIPLCMGGSNELNNLWPQHISVYEVTDPLEQMICEKMSQGVLKQARAVQYIKDAKGDLNRVDDIISEVQGL